MAKITKIPATINPITRAPATADWKRRVAGYARVSTASDEQFTSYEAQIDYYTQYMEKMSRRRPWKIKCIRRWNG